MGFIGCDSFNLVDWTPILPTIPKKIARYAHWTPRYALDRMRLLVYETLHPDSPWLAPDAVRFLENWLQPNHAGFEWGAGRSTIWLSKRVARLTSIEHDEVWFQRVRQLHYALPHNNVDLRLIPATDMSEDNYVDAISMYAEGELDFVLVDGLSALRDRCTLTAIPKIRSGGVLVIDDIHRYLPSPSRAPLALPPNAKPLTEEWDFAMNQLSRWGKRTFTSGVTDTAIWLRD